MLSTDQKIFDAGSEAHRRMIGYDSIFDELHIIVYTNSSAGYKRIALSDNVFAHPTGCISRVFYFRDAIAIAKSILRSQVSIADWAVSSQDPFETGLVGYFIKKKFAIPWQVQIHTDIFSPYFWRESLKNKLRVLLARRLITRADGIRVVSERIASVLVRDYPALRPRVTVLPVFVEIEKTRAMIIRTDLRKKYHQFDLIILMASRLTKEKNIGMAIDAIHMVVAQMPDTGLVIVGDGPEKDKLQKKIARNDLMDSVIIEPWTDDLASYYKTADCYVLTSNYEGYGRTVVEAMAAGCPVIMTDVGIARDIVKNDVSGMIVPVMDTDALHRALARFMEDAALRPRLVTGAYQAVEDMKSKEDYFTQYKMAIERLSS